MPLGPIREKLLQGLGRKRGRAHRYTLARWIVGIAFTAGVASLPLLGVLRFDLWGGRHVLLGREVGLVEAAKAFAFPFLAVNVLIVLASRFAGRYLCGFVCPYGSLARLAEWLRPKGRTRRARFGATLALLAVCSLLAAILFSFWIDWAVFARGSALAISLSASFLAVTSIGLYAAVRRLGLRFCRDWCPSGVYFALLGTESANGVVLAHPETCTDCGACSNVCPMDLEPRELLTAEPRAARGFYPERMSSLALCIRCGDCVIACDGVRRDPSRPTSLRLGWLKGAPGRADGTPS